MSKGGNKLSSAQASPKLSATIKTEFESILGASWVITDKPLMSGYAWSTGVGKVPGSEEKKFSQNWPLAVLLPSSTEEVAAIVKCCYRNGIDYKAHSTGYGSMNNVANNHCVSIDLRRMDELRIVPEDRLAIIGPYATAGKLQAEALKHGMTCHIVGAGPAHSPLASATSLIGVGITSQGTSANMRNLLSWEWVSPQGEIIRGGACESGDQWFSGEGPGPGTRGMIRGFFGGGGALGVFTQIGIKLYPVPVKGPLKNTGKKPQIGTPLPENWGLYHIVWPDADSARDASFELLQDDLCFTMLRMPTDHIGWTITSTNAEYCEKVIDDSLPPIAKPENRINWTVLTTGYSPDEHQWRKEAISDIVERTGGRFLALEKDDEDLMCHALLTSQYVPRCLRPSSSITTSFGVLDSFHFLPRAMQAGELALKGENQPGGNLNEGAKDEHWIWPHEGRYMWAENIVNFNSADIKSREAAAFCLLDHYNLTWKTDEPVGFPALAVGPLMDLQGKRIGEPQKYIRNVKNHFDPENHSASNEHVIPHLPELVKKVLPPLRPVLWSKPVLKLLAKKLAKDGM